MDVANCSAVSYAPICTIIRSDSANSDNILNHAPVRDGIDVLFIVSPLTVTHVYKEIYGFFPYLKKGGVIFVDDVDSTPYTEGKEMDSFYVETENRQILNFIKFVFEANMDRLELSIRRGWTGLARLDSARIS